MASALHFGFVFIAGVFLAFLVRFGMIHLHIGYLVVNFLWDPISIAIDA